MRSENSYGTGLNLILAGFLLGSQGCRVQEKNAFEPEGSLNSVDAFVETKENMSFEDVPLLIEHPKTEITLPDAINRQKEFWKYIFSEVDTNHTVVFNMKTYELISVGDRNQFSEKEAKEIKNGFRGMQIKTGLKEKVEAAFDNLDLYKPVIIQELISRNLDTSLIALTALESLGDNNAVSKTGCTGLYQFSKGTGRGYGLTINSYIDQRKDPFIAAKAFADYIQSLNKMFEGNQGLMLTSYNYGEGDVMDLRKEFARKERVKVGEVDFFDIFPHIEDYNAQNFYGSFLAMQEIYNESGRSKTSLRNGEQELALINLNDKYMARELIKMFGMEKEEIQKYNPSLTDAFFRDNATVDSGYVFRFLPEKMPFKKFEKMKW